MSIVMSIGDKNIIINMTCTKQECTREDGVCTECDFCKIDATGIDARMILKMIMESERKV